MNGQNVGDWFPDMTAMSGMLLAENMRSIADANARSLINGGNANARSAWLETDIEPQHWDGMLGGAGSRTKLYRVMSDAEYDSIVKNGGKFSNYDHAMEEKWFATSPNDAAKWGSKFYPDGKYKMIEIEIPTNLLGQMYHVENLDVTGKLKCQWR